MKNESDEQKGARSERSRSQLAAESPEDRQARLQRLSANQCERLATESAGERQARLQRMNINQCERLATESF